VCSAGLGRGYVRIGPLAPAGLVAGTHVLLLGNDGALVRLDRLSGVFPYVRAVLVHERAPLPQASRITIGDDHEVLAVVAERPWWGRVRIRPAKGLGRDVPREVIGPVLSVRSPAFGVLRLDALGRELLSVADGVPAGTAVSTATATTTRSVRAVAVSRTTLAASTRDRTHGKTAWQAVHVTPPSSRVNSVS